MRLEAIKAGVLIDEVSVELAAEGGDARSEKCQVRIGNSAVEDMNDEVVGTTAVLGNRPGCSQKPGKVVVIRCQCDVYFPH